MQVHILIYDLPIDTVLFTSIKIVIVIVIIIIVIVIIITLTTIIITITITAIIIIIIIIINTIIIIENFEKIYRMYQWMVKSA